jgi:pyroglutamyl-peptidase
VNDAANRTLVTGFLAFEGFEVNPSALLAQSCGRPFELIEVSYAAAGAFVAALDESRFDRLLLIGVAGRSSKMRIETTARNIIGARPDVRGGSQEPRKIDAGGPDVLDGNLWGLPAFEIETDSRKPSDNAGDYLCNYIYYVALQRFESSERQIGFLHVPPLEMMALETQKAELSTLLEMIERQSPSPSGRGRG